MGKKDTSSRYQAIERLLVKQRDNEQLTSGEAEVLSAIQKWVTMCEQQLSDGSLYERVEGCVMLGFAKTMDEAVVEAITRFIGAPTEAVT